MDGDYDTNTIRLPGSFRGLLELGFRGNYDVKPVPIEI